MKKTLTLPAFLVASLCVLGCGNGSSPNMTGSNWGFTATNALFGMYLTQSGTSISGEATYVPICGSAMFSTSGVPFAVSGSLKNGVLSLSGGGLTINASIAQGGNSFEGSFSFPLECGGTGGIAGAQFSSFAGTWSGTFQSSTGNNSQVTATLTEGAVDSTGFPALTGSVTISGSPCFNGGSLIGTQMGSLVSGQSRRAIIATGDGEIDFLATPNTNGTLDVIYLVFGGSCNGDSGTGTLTRQ